jgi:hypothetical protein
MKIVGNSRIISRLISPPGFYVLILTQCFKQPTKKATSRINWWLKTVIKSKHTMVRYHGFNSHVTRSTRNYL